MHIPLLVDGRRLQFLLLPKSFCRIIGSVAVLCFVGVVHQLVFGLGLLTHMG